MGNKSNSFNKNKSIFRKTLAITTIALFIASSFIPSLSADEKDNDPENVEKNIDTISIDNNHVSTEFNDASSVAEGVIEKNLANETNSEVGSAPSGGRSENATQYVINWDDQPLGATSGSGDFYNWARTSGDDFYIYDGFVNSSPKSLYLDAGTQAFYDDPDFGEINVELPYKLTNITMDIKHILFQSSGEDGVLNVYRFYNGTHLMGQLGMKTWMFSSRYGYYPGMVQYEHGAYYFNETTSQWVFFKSWGFTSNEDINVLIEPSVAEDKIRFAVQHQGGAWGYSDYSIFDNPGDKWGGITKITISQVIDDYGGGLWRC